ncbi:MAG: hypothetical protein H6622_02670 [Halobacteriovoraceae bacterium]|nr:hypothetical protein [Halobacteriovoraceae bacterium]
MAKKIKIFSILTIATISIGSVFHVIKKNELKKQKLLLLSTKQSISRSIFEKNLLESDLNNQVRVEYTVDEDLMKYLNSLLLKYKSDFSAVVVIDNNNGEIIGFSGFEKSHNSLNYALPFSSTNPSASLIKIVTAASLLEKKNLGPDEKLAYSGRSTTLYKYQLKDKKTKWTREQSLERAFATSNNVIFAKGALKYLSNEDLLESANDFGFNKKLTQFLDTTSSSFQLPKDDYNRAELASGLNSDTMITPVHAAILSSIVANDGTMLYPSLVKKILDRHRKEVVWQKKDMQEEVIHKEKSKQLESMMVMAVKKGTAKRLYRSLNKKIRDKLIIGAKTGAMTGGIPYGKRDWLTLFVRPQDSEDRGFSISIMNVNVNKWHYKTTFLAKKIIEYLYK